jgi:uncharacterized membrane protein
MILWIAIGLALVAYSVMNIGAVLLKKAAMLVSPEQRRRAGGLAAYFTTVWGWCGFACIVAGFLLFVLATTFRAAPISVLRPLSAFGIVVVALFAVTYLRERLRVVEWLAVGLLLAGVVLLGIGAVPPPAQLKLINLPHLLIYVVACTIVSSACLVLLRFPQNQATSEALYGLLSGVLLGVGYLNLKALSLAIQEENPAALALAVVTTVIGLLGGFWAMLRGFHHGRALLLTAIKFVASQVVTGFGGIYCVGEILPAEPELLAAQVAGYVVISAGFLAFVSVPMQHHSRPGTI